MKVLLTWNATIMGEPSEKEIERFNKIMDELLPKIEKYTKRELNKLKIKTPMIANSEELPTR